MKTILPLIALLLVCSCKTTKPTAKDDVAVIRSILDKQQKAWSENDLEGFMSGYWQSEELTYFSRGKISKGWQTTLANYKRNYPTTKETGTLNFEIANITQINEDAYWVMGSYFLTREAGNANGTFMIVFKRINGEWKIIGDSSC
ncbi:nuclear transport factor 2 family protein [Maribacter algarum]|uniref:Nuclear transport factor 2 family protein n=1 Tax=Maribacter algarum (ex Zhang et al. 2020) TaxID=2578118 RepID=A0A5S3QIV4_9FLAO|nr:nuclear transport factor 2 family protein [Maribacter algarum]TMM57505.1 nuclear transport factor 2 family protein [Maribacter algarum]